MSELTGLSDQGDHQKMAGAGYALAFMEVSFTDPGTLIIFGR